MPTRKAQGHGDSVYRRHLQYSIAKNMAVSAIFASVIVYLFYYIGVSIWAGTLLSPFILTYICFTIYIVHRAWPNFLYSVLLPYTEWKMYTRDYVQLNRVYRRTLSLRRYIGLSSYAEIVTRCNLANVQLQLGEHEDAEAIYRSSLKLIETLPRSQRLQNLQRLYGVYTKCGLVVSLCHQEKFLEAELMLAEVLDAINDKKISSGLYEGYAYYLLGHTHLGLKEPSAADNVLKGMRLIENAKSGYGFREHVRSQMINACNLVLARIYLSGGNINDANSYNDKFFAELENGRSTISPLAVKDLVVIARQYLQLEDYARAEKVLQLCYFLMAPTPFSPLARETLTLYEKLLAQTGRSADIVDLKSWLHPVSLLTYLK